MKNARYRKLATVAMLGAIGFVLMFIEFSVPLMPAFIKFDFSELPALLAAFAFGPAAGAGVCVIKNALHALVTNSGGVGELSNLAIGLVYCMPAGLIYRRMKSRRGALLGSLVGVVLSSVFSLPWNYFVIYPLYAKLMPIDAIIGMYSALDPSVTTLFDALLRFNVPFTAVKELLVAAVVFLIYKRVSPLLHGRK
ncbi:MAG: ECF transporter S component [Clostridiaceae bacterium]|nr:ECF transporter S component [Clostridiaceae bacterium]